MGSGTGSGNRSVYIGTTGHTFHKRTMEHKGAVGGQRLEDSALPKHMASVHPNQVPLYVGSIIGGSQKNLERYVIKAMCLEKIQDGRLWKY